MRNYELALLLQARLNETELQENINAMVSFLQNQGALLLNQDIKGRRSFFVAKKQQREALLATLRFSFDASKLDALETFFKQNPNVVRYLLTTWAPKKTREKVISPSASQPGAVLEQKEEKKADIGEIDKRLEEIFKDQP